MSGGGGIDHAGAVTGAATVRHALRRGLLQARAGALHFPAYFLGVEWEGVAPPECTATIPATPVVLAEDESFAASVVAMLADVTLGAATRLETGKAVGLSTVTLELEFTDAAVRAGRLRCTARSSGRVGALAAAAGDLRDEHGEVLGLVRARFVVNRPRDDPRHRLYPWESTEPLSCSQAPAGEDEAEIERFVLDRLGFCEDHGAVPAGLFARLHGIEAGHDADRDVATASQPLGPHVANRSGLVQGGFLAGLAFEACVTAARTTSGIAARPLTLDCTFVRPGRVTDDYAQARACVVHSGRRLTVVHGLVANPEDRALVHCRALFEGPGK